jgi:hypothetical protein
VGEFCGINVNQRKARLVRKDITFDPNSLINAYASNNVRPPPKRMTNRLDVLAPVLATGDPGKNGDNERHSHVENEYNHHKQVL